MTVALEASQDTVDHLGPSGLAELAAHLWPANCQTCGRPLGHRPPALVVGDVVDDAVGSAIASLHHPLCRRPSWNADPEDGTTDETLVSHAVRTLLVPLQGAGGDPSAQRPALLVNPGLEQVQLRRGENDRWRVSTVGFYRRYGLRLPRAGFTLGRPVPGVRGRLAADQIVVRLGSATWSTPLHPLDLPGFADQVHELGGIVLAVSTLLHPGQLTDAAPIAAAVDAEQVAMGWVAVDLGDGPSGEHLEHVIHPTPTVLPRTFPVRRSAADRPTTRPPRHPRRGRR